MDKYLLLLLCLVIIITIIITILTIKYIYKDKNKDNNKEENICTNNDNKTTPELTNNNETVENTNLSIYKNNQKTYNGYYYAIIAILEHYKNTNEKLSQTNLEWRNNYYKSQIIKILKQRYSFYTLLYFGLSICFILYYFLVYNNPQDTNIKKIIISIFIILYPLLIDQIITFFLSFYNPIKDMVISFI